MQNVIMMMGLPASGKSTASKQFIESEYEYINRDSVGGKLEALIPLLRELLKDGKSVVLDNTHVTKKQRKLFIDVIKEYGVPIECYFIDTSVQQCKINYYKREGVDAKSPNFLYILASKLEIPTEEEGFSKITIFT